jgi:NAD+ synthase (glutamine-hydrolysing)
MAQKPELMINISASPFDYDHDEDRKEVIRLNVKKYKLPMIYCNSVGAQTEIVFDGGSLIYDQHGNLFREMKYFEEDGCLVDTNDLMDPAKSTAQEQGRAMGLDMRVAKTDDPDKIVAYLTSDNNMSQIKSALVLGIRDYFGKMGFPKAILGSSGGIDSAVTLALAVEALGKENVTAILMPSDFSSDHSVSDALELSSNLGNPFEVVSIQNVYETFLQTLSPVFKDSPFGLAEENIQSRSRGNLLMAIANKFGFVLLNTSNKSELATGYGTLYGDMAGGLSVLGDLYKTQVYALARFINKEKEIIPESIITKAPSAELRPGQKDSDSLPEYDVLDRILYLYIERYQSAREIVAKRFDLHVVQRVLHLINTSEYKRNQFCPIIRVSCKAFGVGRRIPIVAKHVS